MTSSATHIRYTPRTSMWKKRSMLEKVLLVISGTLLFVIFVLAFLLGAADDRIREARVNIICMSVRKSLYALIRNSYFMWKQR